MQEETIEEIKQYVIGAGILFLIVIIGIMLYNLAMNCQTIQECQWEPASNSCYCFIPAGTYNISIPTI